MNQMKGTLQRTALILMALVLAWVFLTPVQAFADGIDTGPDPDISNMGTSEPMAQEPVAEEPVVEEPVVEEPVAEEPVVEEPVVEEPVVEEPVVEEPVVEEPVVEEPVAEEPVVEEPVVEEPVIEEPVVKEPVVEEPVVEEPVVEEPVVDQTVTEEPPVSAPLMAKKLRNAVSAPASDSGDTVEDQETAAENQGKGSAYLKGDNDEWVKYENGEGGNAIQQAVDAAIQAGKQSITVVVQDGTYSGGLQINNSGTDAAGNARESIVVNIVAHDAYEKPADAPEGNSESVYPVPVTSDGSVDTSMLTAGSAGGVKLEDGVSVKNVELLLAGIYLSLKEQKENQGKIESLLTEPTGTSQDIQVADSDHFTYFGTSQADTANITLTDVADAKIESGAGSDILDVSIGYTQNVYYEDPVPETSDPVIHEIPATTAPAAPVVSIHSGGGDDKISVKQTNKVTVQNDKVISVYTGSGSLTVDGGSGADTISLSGSNNLIDIEQNLAERICRIAAKVCKDVASTAVITGGDGDDLLNLDTSWNLSSFGMTNVDYQAGTGNDRLHFTGGLDANADDKVNGSLSADGTGSIAMKTDNTLTKTEYKIADMDLWFNKTVTSRSFKGVLNVIMDGVDALTDNISGKDTVNVVVGTDGKLMANGQPVQIKPFTDYILDLGEDTKHIDSVRHNGGQGLLSNFIIKGQHLVLDEKRAIIMDGVTVVLEAVDGSYESGTITVKGKIEADNILLKLTSTDAHEITLLERSGEGSNIGMDAGIMDVVSNVGVIIAQTASLTATKVVDILAQSLQTKGLIPNLTDLVPGFAQLEKAAQQETLKKIFGFESVEKIKEAGSINFISVKLANAVVTVLGKIQAAAVRIASVAKVETNASNAALRDFGLPLAVGVVMGEAGVVVGEDAQITAKDSILLKAESEIKMNTKANSGRLPFTLGVSIVDNKAYVDVQDSAKLITNGGDIILDAKGNVQVITSAAGSNVKSKNHAVVPSTDSEQSKSTTQIDKGSSGGFFAISVVTQDVRAALKDSASSVFAGALKVNSTANASVVNKAVSNPEEGGKSMTLAQMIKMLAGSAGEDTEEGGGYFGKILRAIKNKDSDPDDPALSEEEKRENARKKAEEKKKNDTIGNFIDKLTGTAEEENEDDVSSLIDKATSSANSGNTDSTHTVQLVGALAVTYANNNNKAYIDTLGTVAEYTEEGMTPAGNNTIQVLANGEMHVETLADGSPVKKDDPGAADKNGKNKDGPQDTHYSAHTHGAVKVDSLTNGTILVDAAVGGSEGSLEIINRDSFSAGPEIYDTVDFVIKASYGYKMAQDKDGNYVITNKYKNVMNGEEKTEQITVQYVGKDADGNLIYKGSHKLISNNNVLTAEFVPNGNAITATITNSQLGSVAFSDAQEDGKELFFANKDDFVYVKINLKSGVSLGATPGYEGGTLTHVKTENNEDGTKTMYYSFRMPDSKVAINIPFVGMDMTVNVDNASGGEVWIHNADSETSGEAVTSYRGKVGEKVKIVIQLAEGNYLTANSLMFAGKTPVYVKNIEAQGNGQYVAFVNIPAVLKTEGDATADNILKLTYKTTTNPKEAQQTIEDKGTALGAGLAVDVTRYNNQAYIANMGGSAVTANSIQVKANTSALNASAQSKAGFVAADLGVAGAITVHLVSANNEALIGGAMQQINLNGGDLEVASLIENSQIVTKAEAAGDGAKGPDTDPDSVGVGAGIAVGVSNLVVSSRILDTVEIKGNIENLNINAGHTGTESMAASAGASGGTSVVPVLALNVSGVSVLADSGKYLANVLKLTGDAIVNAANSITRTITADAAAVGHGVGAGASFIIDILNDSAKAKLGRSVHTDGKLSVSAESVSRLNAAAKSGAKGSISEDAGDSSSGGSGEASGQSPEEPPPSGSKNGKADDLPDDYYAGLDDLFGDDYDVELEESDDPESLAPLFREGDADKFVDSNKESASSLAGLVDIKDNHNQSTGNVNSANVANAFENRQKAETPEGSVQVAATMVLNVQSNEALARIDEVASIHAGGTVSVTSRHDTDGVIMADASSTQSTTGVGVAVAINAVTYSNMAQILTDEIAASELIVRADIFEEETEETADGFLESIKTDILSTTEDIENFIDEVMAAAGKDSLLSYVSNYLGNLGVENSKELENGIAQLILQWVGELLQGNKPSFPTAEQEDIIKNQTIEYGKKVFQEVKKNFSLKKLFSLTLGEEGLWGGIKSSLNSIQDINLRESAAAAMFSYLSGKLGSNEEPESIGPKISTGAVSGAGATNVGVAGSVAISVVIGQSKAYIADAENGKMNVTGKITVQSKASQEVYTSAGASVDALGRVEKNKDATDTANSTQGGNSNADSGKSVGVGAAVALSFADLYSDAGIGEGWMIQAADLLMDSRAENNVQTASVSGTDPLAREEDPSDKPDESLTEEQKKEKEKEEAEKKAAEAMKHAVDASVAVNLIQNAVKTYLAQNSVLRLIGNLDMFSYQSGVTNTNASGFAMGNNTAVGAAVAINLAFSQVLTSFEGSGTVDGHAVLDSATENQDDATALATAMGAEMDRYFARIRNAEKVVAYNKKQDTEHPDDKRVRIENETSNKVSEQLKRASRVSDPEETNKDKSNAAQPLSVQAIKSQKVKTESTNQTDPAKNGSIGNTVTEATNGNAGNAVSGMLNEQHQEGQSIHVAAAVGVNVTAHNAKTLIKGNLTAGGIRSNVDNTGNFATASTGAALSESRNSNTVGVAVAVSVNGNKAEIEIPDGVRLVVTGDPNAKQETPDEVLGNASFSTDLHQNSTGDALHKYGALAIAGSSSGKGGKVGLAGSVAVIAAKGTSAILLGNNVSITGTTDDTGAVKPAAGSVTIASSDKSKLSAAALAATKSGGATAGVGASFALLYAENMVLSQAGDDFCVCASDFNMTATKEAVDLSDFETGGSLGDYISVLEVDESGNGGYNKDNADDYGMIVIQRNQNGTYNIFTNLKAENILDVIQWSSILASVNYYSSAAAGTVMERSGDTSNQKAAVAGAVSMLFNESRTGVSIGRNAKITTSDITNIYAYSDANTRLLGGALSSSGAKAGIGLNVATACQNDKVYATIGENSQIYAGQFSMITHAMSDMLVITAAAVNASGTSVGGALNVVINNSGAKSNVGSNTKILSTGSVDLSADAQANVVLGSVTVSISGGTDKGASVGAIVSVTSNASAAEATVGDRAEITSKTQDITITALNQEQVVSILAAAARSGNGGAGAGNLSVLTTDGKAAAKVGNETILTARQDITVKAHSIAHLIDFMLAAAASTDAPAVGATILVNIFGRETSAVIGNDAILISTNGNVLVQADSHETAVIFSVAGAAASQNAVSGNIQVNVANSITGAFIGGRATVKAWDSIGVTANQDTTVVAISPSLTLGLNSTAVGASIQTNVLTNEVRAIIGEYANLIAYAQNSSTNGIQTANRQSKRKGIILSALEKDLMVAGGVSAGAGNNAVSGVVETLVNRTTVIANMGTGAVVKTGFRSGDPKDSAFTGEPSGKEGELCAEADSHATMVLFGGAFSATTGTGVGATVITLVYDKTVEANVHLHTETVSDVHGSVNVTANTKDLVALVSVNFGVSNATAANVGGNVLIFQDTVRAQLSGKLLATRNVTIRGDSLGDLINAVASVSGSLANAAVSGAALVTYFKGITQAFLGEGSGITCADLKVMAASTANINSDTVGLTATFGSAAVSGLVNIIVTNSQTIASIGSGSSVNAADIQVLAADNYDLLAIAASLSGGSNGIGVTAVVTVAKNTVLAYIGDKTSLNSQNLTVQAVSSRNIRNYAGSIAAGATAGVGATVMVAVIGGKLDQDSANAIAKGFQPDTFVNGISENSSNPAKAYLAEIRLSSDLASDETKASGLNVGNGGKYTGTDGYRSDEFNKQYKPGTNPGEYISDDITNTDGSELGLGKPQGDYKNVINAYIGKNCTITVKEATVVEANEKLNVDIITASGSVGGTAGVNVGVAVVVAFSNVLAEVQSGTNLSCGDVTVHAVTGGDGSISNDKAAEILAKTGIQADSAGSSIRVIAITIGLGSIAGVSPSVAVVNMASASVARMNGVNGNANGISVRAETLYPEVLAVTGAIGVGGTAGVSASVAVVTFHSETTAEMIGSTDLTAGSIDVHSVVDNTAKAYAASLAGGLVGVNGGVAVITNRSETNTCFGNGVYHVNDNVTVNALVNTSAESYIVSVAAGGVAVNLNAAVVNQHARILTRILGTGSSKLMVHGNAQVSNDITAQGSATTIAISAGGVSVMGNVLLVFNYMNARASIENMPFTVNGALIVGSSMDAGSRAELASATLGAVAVGLSTSYVGLNAQNLAYLLIPQFIYCEAGSITITAGSDAEENNFNATASTIAGQAAGISVGLNAAVADNRAQNEAKLESRGVLVIGDSDSCVINVMANSAAKAMAEIVFVSLGGVNAFAATAVSLLRIYQAAQADLADVRAWDLNVESVLNQGENIDSSHAKLVTGSVGLYNANANVAVAYGKSISEARADILGSQIGNKVNVRATGTANVKSETVNQALGLFSGSVFVNVAYGSGQFNSSLILSGQTVSAGEVNVGSSYMADSYALLTPAASGLNLNAGGFNVNLAVAKAAARAASSIAGSGVLNVAGKLSLYAEAKGSKAVADIIGAKTSISGASFGANIADSQLALEQTVNVSNVTINAGSISIFGTIQGACSEASTGSNAGKKLNLVGGIVNTANANVYAKNILTVHNAAVTAANELLLKVSCDDLSVNATARALDFELSGLDVAVTKTLAKVTALSNQVFIEKSSLSGGNVHVAASSNGTKVIAVSSVPRTNATLIGFGSIQANADLIEKITSVNADAASKLRSTAADILLEARSDIMLKAGSAHPSTSVSALVVNDYRFNVSVNNTTAMIGNYGEIISARDVKLNAYDDVKAEIIMDSGSIGLFNKNSAEAGINVWNSRAYIYAHGTIYAGNDIDICTNSDQQLSTKIDKGSSNLWDAGEVSTATRLNRSSQIEVNGLLTSRDGNIDIQALLSEKDKVILRIYLSAYIKTLADGSDYPRANGNLSSTSEIKILKGSQIKADSQESARGNINIMARSSGAMDVESSRETHKPGGRNHAYATAAADERIGVYVGEDDKTKVRIEGQNVSISSQSEMYVASKASSYSYTGAGFNFEPTATTIFKTDLDTVLRSSVVVSQDQLKIYSYLPYVRAVSNAYAFKEYFAGYNNPHAITKGYIYTDLIFDNNTTLDAVNLDLKTFSPKDNANDVRVERNESWYYNGLVFSSIGENHTTYSNMEASMKQGNTLNDYFNSKKFVPGGYSDDDKIHFAGTLTWSAHNNAASNASQKTDVFCGGYDAQLSIAIDPSGNVTILGFEPGVSSSEIVTAEAVNGSYRYNIDGAAILAKAAAKNRYCFYTVSAYSVNGTNNSLSNQELCKYYLTITNESVHDLCLNNVNEPKRYAAEIGGSNLDIFTSGQADVIFNGSCNFQHGSISLDRKDSGVSSAGGEVILHNAGISGQVIRMIGMNSIRNQTGTGPVCICFGEFAGDSIHALLELVFKESIDLLIDTRDQNLTIDRIQSENGGIRLQVVNDRCGTDSKVTLGDLNAQNRIVLVVPGDILAGDPDKTQVAASDISITAGGAIGETTRHLRIDSFSQVYAESQKGGVYLTEVNGDLFIYQICSAADVELKTLNGSIYDKRLSNNLLQELDETVYTHASLMTRAVEIYDKIQTLQDYIKVMQDLSFRMNVADQKKAMNVLAEGREKIKILHSVESVSLALTILEEEIGLRSAEVETLYKQADADIQRANQYLENAVEYYLKLRDLNDDTIVANGKIRFELNSRTGAADLGTSTSAVDVNAAGKVTVVAGQGTTLGNVYLNAYQNDLYLDPIHAGGTVGIHALRNIHGSSDQETALIKADKLILRSVMLGYIGTEQTPITTQVNIINAFGASLYITNYGNLAVDQIIATGDPFDDNSSGIIKMIVHGNLLAAGERLIFDLGHELNAFSRGIQGEEVTLNVFGNIGEKETTPQANKPAGRRMLFAANENRNNSMYIYGGNSVNITAVEAFLESNGVFVVDQIKTSGALKINTIAGGQIVALNDQSSIICGSLDASALGYIGRENQKLVIYTDGSVRADSILYGEHLLILPLPKDISIIPTVPGYYADVYVATDSKTGIRVTGYLSQDSLIIVDRKPVHLDCAACEHLHQRHIADNLLFANITLEGSFKGALLVQIPVYSYMERLEGQEVVILTCRNGIVMAIRGMIIDGFICFYTDELGSFLVLEDASHMELSEDGSMILFDGARYPFGGWL